MSLGLHLHRLQVLDREADDKKRRLAEVERDLGDRRALDAAERAVESAIALAAKSTAHQTDLELKLQGLVDKRTREIERLYGGSVRDPRQLAELQEEVASLKRRQDAIEDELLQAMIDNEESEESLSDARSHLAGAKDAFEAGQAGLTQEQGALVERIAQIEEERAAAAASLSGGQVADYESLRRRKGGLAVAAVVGDACAACGVAVSRNRTWHIREGEMVHCANCERIIVLL